LGGSLGKPKSTSSKEDFLFAGSTNTDLDLATMAAFSGMGTKLFLEAWGFFLLFSFFIK